MATKRYANRNSAMMLTTIVSTRSS